MATKKAGAPKPVQVRLSGVPVTCRIILVQLVFLFFIPFAFSIFVNGGRLGPVIFLGLTVVSLVTNVLFSAAFYFDWKNKSYEIRSGGIIEKHGVLYRREQNYACSNIEELILKQGILGRIFDYGTIRLYDPALRQSIFLNNIKSPRYYEGMLRELFQTRNESPSQRIILSQSL